MSDVPLEPRDVGRELFIRRGTGPAAGYFWPVTDMQQGKRVPARTTVFAT